MRGKPSIAAHTTEVYKFAYKDGHNDGWNDAKHAAAAEVLLQMAQTEAERSVLRRMGGEQWEFEKRLLEIETAIRKLSKNDKPR